VSCWKVKQDETVGAKSTFVDPLSRALRSVLKHSVLKLILNAIIVNVSPR